MVQNIVKSNKKEHRKDIVFKPDTSEDLEGTLTIQGDDVTIQGDEAQF